MPEDCDFTTTKHASTIELVPMRQRLNIKSETEDWTGKSDTTTRRKLQNRLNQRASRLRRKQEDVAKDDTSIAQPPHHFFILRSNDGPENVHHSSTRSNEPTQLIGDLPVAAECQQAGRQVSRWATEGYEGTRSFSPNSNVAPLPTDQGLLTLMNCNLIRAYLRNVHLLGYQPEDMCLDIASPFLEPLYLPPHFSPKHHYRITVEAERTLPPTLQSTAVQRTVMHHPVVDTYAFPRYRENLILAGNEIDEVELCKDICYGVDVKSNCTDTQELLDDVSQGEFTCARTGFIVWSDPHLQSSWEVDENFLYKYARLFRGCHELLHSTNYWRESRGEEPLDFTGIL